MVKKIGLIGYGYWGPNLIRNFSALKDCRVTMLADANQRQLALAGKLYPHLRLTRDADELLRDPAIDGVIIATPIRTHYALAAKALNCGKDVLVEKSMTDSLPQARALVALAARKKRILAVDHTFLYSGAVQAVKKLLDSGTAGRLQYIDSQRINLGRIKHDINVVWDLMPHDISIAGYLLGKTPDSVSATGLACNGSAVENIAYMTMFHKNGPLVHVTASWLAPLKLRRMVLGGSAKMITYDDTAARAKVRLHDCGYDASPDGRSVSYRRNGAKAVKSDKTEALRRLAEDFVSCMHTRREPRSSGRTGLEVVKVLRAAMRSLRSGGRRVKVG